ncbi:YafY family protein [Fusibacter sp. 3D3]|uniref:helix-turn-helix transcriptional regulator n=1 Tax=Fusibacter sp. 3D3 TaxID=1048380 RepID=UPI000853D45F|nr:WYL domain-containing transcriptional regulator [Fusibacter sp. 3D3]GAU77697.1 transcriptional regulator [Fusibacter sp. 3D3]
MKIISKASRVGKIIEYLKQRDLVPRNELSQYLGVHPKTISGYISEINEEGLYYIDVYTGPHGGYRLNKRNLSKQLLIDREEYESLRVCREMIKTRFKEIYPEFETLFLKITQNHQEESPLNFILKAHQDNHEPKEERKKQIKLNDAIRNQKKIELESYKRINNVQKHSEKRIIHPYGIIYYKSAPYLVGYCELRNALRIFKLTRIQKFRVLEAFFEKSHDYTNDELLEYCIGIHRGKNYEVKLKVAFPFDEIISEKQWTKDQSIKRIDDNHIEFTGTLEGEEEIIGWLLSMKEFVDVLEPEYIKNKYREKIEKIYQKHFN